jgi:hypothetical protein
LKHEKMDYWHVTGIDFRLCNDHKKGRPTYLSKTPKLSLGAAAGKTRVSAFRVLFRFDLDPHSHNRERETSHLVRCTHKWGNIDKDFSALKFVDGLILTMYSLNFFRKLPCCETNIVTLIEGIDSMLIKF